MGVGLELFGLRKGGTEFPVEVSLGPVETTEGILVTTAIRDITERKLVDESRFRLAAIVESSDDAIISKNLAAIITSWNAGAQHIFGYTSQEAVGRPIAILVPPELREEENRILERLRAGEHIDHYETVRVTKAGNKINVSLSISPIKDSTGTIMGFCKIARDITDRKLAEDALAGMSRKLIEAQEQERARLGRELHDDINQRLAMLAVELEQLQDNPSEIQNRVQELRRQTAEISNDVQALSHELHSSKVEYLGVVGGIKSWCKEFAERQSIEIDFKSDVSSTLPPEIGLSLFRVLQEALHNAVKHSGVRRVEVQLRENWGEVHLVITDSGRGFDVEEAMQGTGLGLTSMRERVRFMNGTITLDSKPMHGTSIHVRVPFRSDDASQRAVS
jgi:PAS domain S-box-containing protein